METERLRLRQFRQDDLEAYAAILANPDVARFFGDGLPAGREDAWRHMAMLVGHWDLLGFGRWCVELRSTGACIGRVGLWRPEGWPGIELGWVIDPAHWGHGYAVEAGREGLRHGFGALRLPRIISLVAPHNHNSRRVAEKLGGEVEREMPFHGQTVLVYRFSTPWP